MQGCSSRGYLKCIKDIIGIPGKAKGSSILKIASQRNPPKSTPPKHNAHCYMDYNKCPPNKTNPIITSPAETQPPWHRFLSTVTIVQKPHPLLQSLTP